MELTGQEEGEWECITDTLRDLTYIWGAAAFIPGMALVAGGAALGFAGLEAYIDDALEDPPRANFKRKITVPEVTFSPPRSGTAIGNKLDRVVGWTVKASAFAQAMTVANECQQGAALAGNERYVEQHARTSSQLRTRLIRHLVSLSNAMAAAGQALKGSDLDQRLTHVEYKALMAGLKKGTVPRGFAASGKRVGFGRASVNAFKEKASKQYIRKLLSVRPSYVLEVAARKILRSSQKLSKL